MEQRAHVVKRVYRRFSPYFIYATNPRNLLCETKRTILYFVRLPIIRRPSFFGFRERWVTRRRYVAQMSPKHLIIVYTGVWNFGRLPDCLGIPRNIKSFFFLFVKPRINTAHQKTKQNGFKTHSNTKRETFSVKNKDRRVQTTDSTKTFVCSTFSLLFSFSFHCAPTYWLTSLENHHSDSTERPERKFR